MSKNELMSWKFQGWDSFGFFIPDERDLFWWDFYVKKEHFNWAVDWDKVEAKELSNWKGKKPEAKIISVKWKKPQNKPKFIEWIYSGWDGNFGFIDVEGMEKGYFVYWAKKNWARDWDKVKAELVEFKWKIEAIVVKVFETEDEILVWVFQDRDRFAFVVPDENKSNDIFIAWSRKNWAHDWDKVEVKIIKRWGKNPEWVVFKVLN